MEGKLIVANWKMNKTKQEANEFFKSFSFDKTPHTVVIAPSFTLLDAVSEEVKNKNIKLASQNVFFADAGAFTGEVSPVMLKDFNVEYVILGHSERRQYFLETDSLVNKKALASLSHNLKPIICVGETALQKEEGFGVELVVEQVKQALTNVQEADLKNIIIAYEPIWAIGSGTSATVEDASHMAKAIVEVVQALYDTKQVVKILYGGSVNLNNAKDFLTAPYLGGLLIGGASLQADTLLQIIKG